MKLSKRVSPWGNEGGSSPFSMAVDPENMIAIFTNRGSGVDYFPYKYQIPDGNVGCGSGMVYAIDLVTGKTVWQWVHPWMYLNNECFDDCTGDGKTERRGFLSQYVPQYPPKPCTLSSQRASLS